MRALTVQQPWASAMFYPELSRSGEVKDVENRTQAWSYRGPLAIHAGARVSQRGVESPLIAPAGVTEHRVTVVDGEARLLYVVGRYPEMTKWGARLPLGAVVGVVDLVDVHTADWCWEPEGQCSPWAESSYVEHGGEVRDRLVHLVLEDPRPLAEPIPAKGRLGLWTPDAELLDRIREQVPA